MYTLMRRNTRTTQALFVESACVFLVFRRIDEYINFSSLCSILSTSPAVAHSFLEKTQFTV